ncbi:MAG: GH92 family glycosyl hydrolase [Bacteroidales bacterium]|nr:GH92 family glycosyl hydrolase [Bacteroidales bacterium]
MKRQAILSAAILAVATVFAYGCSSSASKDSVVDYVDVKIGSGGHGHVFVGASVPFGAVQLGPTSIPQTWDWCSGYHVSDSTVIGFSHTHLSGTGIGDLFDITLMPVTGKVNYARGKEDDPASGLWSYADRTKEVARPGYYSVPLTRYGITAEMTATCRVGLSRYTFPAADDAAVVIDLENGGCWDSAYNTEIQQVDQQTIQGFRFSSGWARNQKIFFYAVFSKPFDSFEIVKVREREFDGKTMAVNYGRASFKTSEGDQVMVKVAISPVSEENAKANLEAELPGWDFEATCQAASTAWDEELSKVKIKTADADSRTVFYTALYHTMIVPSTFSDVNGDYRGADGEVKNGGDSVNYTTFSLWDTYRAQMPLMTILHPARETDMVNTMIGICSEQGRLPVWHLMANETDCMVGNPGIIAVADAIVKDIAGVDKEKAWNSLKVTAMGDDRGQNFRKEYGFIPSDLYNQSVACDMEYAIADAAVAAAASKLGKREDAEFFTSRSHSYRNYMDKETLQARGRLSDGSWRTPFSPYHSAHEVTDYCEGTAWQYTWLAPHDYDGLVEFYGSKEFFLERLDSLFLADSHLEGDNVSSDITGLIGQYVHGNEPSHHILYFYTVAGQPWKTADLVRQVYDQFYQHNPEGLAGNEDAGQMSAWYVLSSLGFYEMEPASTRFWFGAPAFEEADVKVPGGVLKIKAEGLSSANKYIQGVTLNGSQLDRGYIEYSEIMAGGELVLKMGSEQVAWY